MVDSTKDRKKTSSRHAEYGSPDGQVFKYDPLLALVRYADNLDMQESRFSEYQKSTPFRRVYERLGAERSVSGNQSVANALQSKLLKGSTDQARELLEGINESGKATMFEGEFLSLAKSLIDNRFPDGNFRPVEARQESLQNLVTLLNSVDIVIYDGTGSPKKISKEYKDSLILKLSEMAQSKEEGKKIRDNMEDSIQGVIAENIYNDKSTKDNLSPTDKKHLASIKKYLGTMNEISFRHFGGCRPVENVGVKGDTMTIDVKPDVMRRYKGLVAAENVGGQTLNIPVNVYQIWRGVEAFDSLTVKGKKMKVEIKMPGATTFEFDPNKVRKGDSASGAFVEAYKEWESENI